jgi:ATP-dependent Clp protease ATP-binding subunit ClpC
MKPRGLQYERALFLRFYRSLPLAIVRLFALAVTVIGLLIVVASLILSVNPTLLGWALILLAPALIVGSFHLYARYLQDHPDFLLSSATRQAELLNNFDYTALWALLALPRHGYGAMWRELFSDPASASVLYRFGLTESVLNELFKQASNDGEAEKLAASAMKSAADGRLADAFDLIKTLMRHPLIAAYLQQRKLNIAQADNMIDYYQARHEMYRSARFWLPQNRARTGGFAKLWAVSYTNLLDRFTEELGPEIGARAKYFPFYRQDGLVEHLVVELNKKNGQNLLLVGEAGIGKHELFYALAGRILNYQTNSPLDGLQVRMLNLQAILAAAPNVEQLGPLFQALFRDLTSAGDILLFVPEFGALLEESGAGSADTTHLLAEYLSHDKIRLVATVSPEERVTLVHSRSQLESNFSVVEVPSPSAGELEKILLVHLLPIERRYEVFFPIQSVIAVQSLAARYIKDRVSPKREIELLEEVAAAVHSKGEAVVASEDVAAAVEHQVKVPIRVNEQEQGVLLNLEEQLHRRVIGQHRAIKLVSDALIRARAGLSEGKRPIGSFLFLGPTGVGKTETAKALCEEYFGSPQMLIRLDMTEYADANSLTKLLGTDPVKQPGSLTVSIEQQPSTVLLLDELEKSAELVKNVMLQLLDEGRLTTNFGKVLDFTNTIVIATSNAGSDFIKTQVERGVAPGELEKQLLDRLIAERIYTPELLNRFDGVVVFLPLTQAEIKQVVRLQLETLKALVLKDKGIKLEIAESVISELARRGYDPVFGARALQRVIKEDLETTIARQLLNSAASPPGSTLEISSL